MWEQHIRQEAQDHGEIGREGKGQHCLCKTLGDPQKPNTIPCVDQPALLVMSLVAGPGIVSRAGLA